MSDNWNEDCPICGCMIGPSHSYPWHLVGEDCRAIKEPVDQESRDDPDAWSGGFAENH
jgi:hypothetical protein